MSRRDGAFIATGYFANSTSARARGLSLPQRAAHKHRRPPRLASSCRELVVLVACQGLAKRGRRGARSAGRTPPVGSLRHRCSSSVCRLAASFERACSDWHLSRQRPPLSCVSQVQAQAQALAGYFRQGLSGTQRTHTGGVCAQPAQQGSRTPCRPSSSRRIRPRSWSSATSGPTSSPSPCPSLALAVSRSAAAERSVRPSFRAPPKTCPTSVSTAVLRRDRHR